MGFSISGTFAILLVATLAAFGMYYSATADKAERVNAAKQASTDAYVAIRNTHIDITNVTYQGNKLRIHVNNTGSTTLQVNATDVIVDGVYQQRPFDKETVDNEADTNLWEPGEELFIRIRDQSKPDRVKVVTEHGIANAEVV